MDSISNPLSINMGFLKELWNNQPNIVIGSGIVISVLFGIYIQLLNTYK